MSNRSTGTPSHGRHLPKAPSPSINETVPEPSPSFSPPTSANLTVASVVTAEQPADSTSSANSSGSADGSDGTVRIIAIAVGPILGLILLGLFIWVLKRKGFLRRFRRSSSVGSAVDHQDNPKHTSLKQQTYRHPSIEAPFPSKQNPTLPFAPPMRLASVPARTFTAPAKVAPSLNQEGKPQRYPIRRQFTAPLARISDRRAFQLQHEESLVTFEETQFTSTEFSQELLDMYGGESVHHPMRDPGPDPGMHTLIAMPSKENGLNDKSSEHVSMQQPAPTVNIVRQQTIPERGLLAPPQQDYGKSMTSEQSIPEYSEWLESVHEPAPMPPIPVIQLHPVEPLTASELDAVSNAAAPQLQNKSSGDDSNPSSSSHARRSNHRRKSRSPYEVWGQKRISHKGTHIIGHNVEKSQWKLGGLKYISREEQRRLRRERREQQRQQQRESAVSRISRFSRATRKSLGKSVLWRKSKSRTESVVAPGTSSIYDSFHVW